VEVFVVLFCSPFFTLVVVCWLFPMSAPSQRPRRSAQPKPYALAEDFDYVESDYDDEEEEEEEEEEEDSYELEEEVVDVEDDDKDDLVVANDDDDEEEEEEYEDQGEDEEDHHLHHVDSVSDEEGVNALDNEDDDDVKLSHVDDEMGEEEEQKLFTTAAIYHPTSQYEEPVYNEMSRRYPHWPMLTLYDIHRRPRRVPSGRWRCTSSMHQLLHAFRCVICWSTLKKPMVVRECMHRFCEDCIGKSLRMGRNECPVCRVFVPSKRNLAVDESAELLIMNTLGPELRELEFEDLETDEESTEDGGGSEDRIMTPRLRRAKRRNEQLRAEPFVPSPKKRAKSTVEKSEGVAEKGIEEEDDDDDDNDDEEDDNENPTVLFDFCIQPHRDEYTLDPLPLPYIRVSGDATIATIIKFIQAKLSCDRHLSLSTTMSGRKEPEHTPLHMVGAQTKTLFYKIQKNRHRGRPRKDTTVAASATTTPGTTRRTLAD